MSSVSPSSSASQHVGESMSVAVFDYSVIPALVSACGAQGMNPDQIMSVLDKTYATYHAYSRVVARAGSVTSSVASGAEEVSVSSSRSGHEYGRGLRSAQLSCGVRTRASSADSLNWRSNSKSVLKGRLGTGRCFERLLKHGRGENIDSPTFSDLLALPASDYVGLDRLRSMRVSRVGEGVVHVGDLGSQAVFDVMRHLAEDDDLPLGDSRSMGSVLKEMPEIDEIEGFRLSDVVGSGSGLRSLKFRTSGYSGMKSWRQLENVLHSGNSRVLGESLPLVVEPATDGTDPLAMSRVSWLGLQADGPHLRKKVFSAETDVRVVLDSCAALEKEGFLEAGFLRFRTPDADAAGYCYRRMFTSCETLVSGLYPSVYELMAESAVDLRSSAELAALRVSRVGDVCHVSDEGAHSCLEVFAALAASSAMPYLPGDSLWARLRSWGVQFDPALVRSYSMTCSVGADASAWYTCAISYENQEYQQELQNGIGALQDAIAVTCELHRGESVMSYKFVTFDGAAKAFRAAAVDLRVYRAVNVLSVLDPLGREVAGFTLRDHVMRSFR